MRSIDEEKKVEAFQYIVSDCQEYFYFIYLIMPIKIYYDLKKKIMVSRVRLAGIKRSILCIGPDRLVLQLRHVCSIVWGRGVPRLHTGAYLKILATQLKKIQSCIS